MVTVRATHRTARLVNETHWTALVMRVRHSELIHSVNENNCFRDICRSCSGTEVNEHATAIRVPHSFEKTQTQCNRGPTTSYSPTDFCEIWTFVNTTFIVRVADAF